MRKNVYLPAIIL